MLVISSVDYSHVGEYTCRATNPAGSVTHATRLRVNGKFWSFWKALELNDILLHFRLVYLRLDLDLVVITIYIFTFFMQLC